MYYFRFRPVFQAFVLAVSLLSLPAQAGVPELRSLLSSPVGRYLTKSFGIGEKWALSWSADPAALARAEKALLQLRDGYLARRPQDPAAFEPTLSYARLGGARLQTLRELLAGSPELSSLRELRFVSSEATLAPRRRFLAEGFTEVEHVNGQWLAFGKTNLAQADAVLTEAQNPVIVVSPRGDFVLTVRGREYAGMVFGEPWVRTMELGKARNGIWIELDLPEASVKSLQAEIEKVPETLSLSCANGICMALEGAGIRLAGGTEAPIFRVPTLNRIFGEGFELPDGSKVPYRVYASGIPSVRSMMRSLKVIDRATLMGHQKLLNEVRPTLEDNPEFQALPMTPAVRTRVYAFLKAGIKISGWVFAAETSGYSYQDKE